MVEWVDVTSSFSEEQRNYKDLYLERTKTHRFIYEGIYQ